MASAARATALGALVLVVGLGGYGVADAFDVVPGVLTTAPVPDPPAPFPTAPGAVDAPEVARVLASLDPDAPAPDPAVVQGLVDDAVDHEWIGDGVGVLVLDALTGDVVAAADPGTARVPASTAKVLTAVASILTLGPDATFRTTVVASPGGDEVVLVGGGDMMLAAGQGDPAAVMGRAGLADLAGEAASALGLVGADAVTVRVDDSLFSGPALSPGWADTDLSGGYVAPVTALAVDVGAVRTDVPYPPRHKDPALAAGQQFADALAAAGVAVSGPVRRAEADPTWQEVAAVDSASVAEVAEYLLHSSDNTITEVLGRHVALAEGLPGSFDGATAAVLKVVAEAGADTTGARLGDCSGLADGSALSPRLLTEVLGLVVDPDRPELRVVANALAIAGLEGTLADRFTASPARGLARAKTGSLRGVTSLTGYVLTADQRLLLFAVLADDTPPGGQLGPRKVIDALVSELATCGCRASGDD